VAVRQLLVQAVALEQMDKILYLVLLHLLAAVAAVMVKIYHSLIQAVLVVVQVVRMQL